MAFPRRGNNFRLLPAAYTAYLLAVQREIDRVQNAEARRLGEPVRLIGDWPEPESHKL